MHPLDPHDPPSIGRFRLVGRLGENSCSRVYLASSDQHRSVALHVIRASHGADTSFRTTLTYRVEGARDLSSPYVARLLDADLDGTTPWIAVEHPHGRSLRALVETHGPLPAEAFRSFASGIAQGLADLHAEHRTHATLTPDTVLLTRRGAMISDPGFEWAAVEVGSDLSNRGFAAPEGKAAPSVDVYAWAAVLVWAAGGQTTTEGIERLPFQLRGLVEACLREDPSLRPTSADLVRLLGGPTGPEPWPSDLAELLERHETTTIHALTATRRRQGPKRGTLLTLSAGGLVLVLITAGVFLWEPTDEDDAAAEQSNTPALITDAGCLEDPGFPSPTEPIDDLDAMQVAFSPDGDLLAVSSYEHGLTLWDWREGEEIARPLDRVGPGEIVFAPVGCQLAVSTFDRFSQSDFEHTVATTVDVPSGETRDYLGPQSERALDGLEEPRRVYSFEYSPSGERAIVNLQGDTNREGRLPNTGLVDLDTGEPLDGWENEGEESFLHAHFLDEEQVLTVDNHTLDLRDAVTGQRRQTVRNNDSLRIEIIEGTEEIFYVTPEQVLRWDLESGSETDSFPVPAYADKEEHTDQSVSNLRVDTELGLLHFSWAISPAMSGGGDPPPPGSDRRFPNHGHLWDLETGEELGTDDITQRPMDFHPDGEAIASIGPEGDVRVLDPETLDVLSTLS